MTLQSSTKPVIALAILLLLLLVNYSSVNGVVRGGDDEGSGIGGTGRMAVPTGESGFGGTGFKPFVTINSANEIEVQRTATVAVDAALNGARLIEPINIAPLELIETTEQMSNTVALGEDQFARNSSPIDIAESIQRDIDTAALQMEQIKTYSLANLAIETTENNQEYQPVEETNKSRLSAEERANTQTNRALNWNDVAAIIAKSSTSLESSTASLAMENKSPESVRASRPTRIQRPELPPVQRARPLQRVNILAPQIKPLVIR